MYKGWRGFLRIGNYMLSIFMCLFVAWVSHKFNNQPAMIMSILCIVWIVIAFINSYTMEQWKEISNDWKGLAIRYQEAALHDKWDKIRLPEDESKKIV